MVQYPLLILLTKFNISNYPKVSQLSILSSLNHQKTIDPKILCYPNILPKLHNHKHFSTPIPISICNHLTLGEGWPSGGPHPNTTLSPRLELVIIGLVVNSCCKSENCPIYFWFLKNTILFWFRENIILDAHQFKYWSSYSVPLVWQFYLTIDQLSQLKYSILSWFWH